MSRWALPCALLLVLIEASRPAAPPNGLEKVLEDFHGRNLVQAAFRGEAVRELVEELLMGTYIELEVDLVQTVCRKHQWRSQNCQIKAGGVSTQTRTNTHTKVHTKTHKGYGLCPLSWNQILHNTTSDKAILSQAKPQKRYPGNSPGKGTSEVI
ncbi:retinoic acid receptor responder protein 2 [Notechis scutatus]|uniref:Retinoic acid receptor responder protein 2 n=1 Tax=Notechis scutatus TaxID=8663 RepID=A0A6J1VJJ0_9SAUR|nr:retinoic acid receptor responder protein 2 [Notechis scutatus]